MAPFEEKDDMTARLKDAIKGMKELEGVIKGVDPKVDPRVLTDFRDATDHIRTTSWAMQMALAQGKTPGGPSPFLWVLTGERVRRTTQLCNDLAKDFEAKSAGADAEKLQNLSQALERLSRLVAPLLSKKA